MLSSLSPLDSRYASAVDPLRAYFSEEALHKARIEVEIRYFIALSHETRIEELPPVHAEDEKALLAIIEDFDDTEAARVREIEKTTRHDVKAVEYYLKEKIAAIGNLGKSLEFVHFGLTSEDVNNLAYGILIHRALKETIHPSLKELHSEISKMGKSWKDIPMLSLTHGQPATPTTVGKEFLVFTDRLDRQLQQLKNFKMQGKLGGAVGNFSAHKAAYPKVNWEGFRMRFVKSLGLDPLEHTTQINPHDDIAELSHLMMRIDTIFIDFCRDLWFYISRGIFAQKVVAGEIGSSAMPHKVNPIDFENAEGNLGIANALFHHFAEKLPISRLQRDLSDSTVQRNLGVAFGHHFLAVQSIKKGLGRISLDRDQVKQELDQHPEVFAEAIQTVLRKNGVTGAYEKLKELTRGEKVTKEVLREYIETLPINDDEKKGLGRML